MFNQTWINFYIAWAPQHQRNVDLGEYFPLEPYPVLFQCCRELRRVDGEVQYLDYLIISFKV